MHVFDSAVPDNFRTSVKSLQILASEMSADKGNKYYTTHWSPYV